MRAFGAEEADDALVDVVSEGFDAGVRFGKRLAADMIATAIGPPMRSAVVASPDYFERHTAPVTPHELRALPCTRCRFASGAPYRWEFERGGIELEIDIDGPLTLSDMGLTVDAALAGVGLAYVFEGMVQTHLAEGRLVRVLEDWCPYYPGLYLYYPSRRQVPAALKAFVEMAQASRWPAATGRGCVKTHLRTPSNSGAHISSNQRHSKKFATFRPRWPAPCPAHP